MKEVASRLRGLGFSVRIDGVEYVSLTGGRVREERLVAVSSDGLVKLTISTTGGSYRLTVLAHGGRASRSLVDALEGLGGSVDYEEDRILAVFRLDSLAEARRIIEAIY
ncbi:MAG: hypothetical protein F7B18_04145 [Desulfurococcales archaeon]|nr:hypothetical protein [Desulfurococcales archaeon]